MSEERFNWQEVALVISAVVGAGLGTGILWLLIEFGVLQ